MLLPHQVKFWQEGKTNTGLHDNILFTAPCWTSVIVCFIYAALCLTQSNSSSVELYSHTRAGVCHQLDFCSYRQIENWLVTLWLLYTEKRLQHRGCEKADNVYSLPCTPIGIRYIFPKS